ncbi:cuticle collagen rol-6 [Trichinella spiralis]|uniref:cuticle collagen rol-6 n=1 Tax=Trichinella spiralis TaxID=6334 RepID=UPI0001EFDB77|nr:cuticle collagen rol-6 [Trichinella spiralis]
MDEEKVHIIWVEKMSNIFSFCETKITALLLHGKGYTLTIDRMLNGMPVYGRNVPPAGQGTLPPPPQMQMFQEQQLMGNMPRHPSIAALRQEARASPTAYLQQQQQPQQQQGGIIPSNMPPSSPGGNMMRQSPNPPAASASVVIFSQFYLLFCEYHPQFLIPNY